MKPLVLAFAIAFTLLMLASFCEAENRSGGGCYRSACYKYCGNNLQWWEDGQKGAYSISVDFFLNNCVN